MNITPLAVADRGASLPGAPAAGGFGALLAGALGAEADSPLATASAATAAVVPPWSLPGDAASDGDAATPTTDLAVDPGTDEADGDPAATTGMLAGPTVMPGWVLPVVVPGHPAPTGGPATGDADLALTGPARDGLALAAAPAVPAAPAPIAPPAADVATLVEAVATPVEAVTPAGATTSPASAAATTTPVPAGATTPPAPAVAVAAPIVAEAAAPAAESSHHAAPADDQQPGTVPAASVPTQSTGPHQDSPAVAPADPSVDGTAPAAGEPAPSNAAVQSQSSVTTAPAAVPAASVPAGATAAPAPELSASQATSPVGQPERGTEAQAAPATSTAPAWAADAAAVQPAAVDHVPAAPSPVASSSLQRVVEALEALEHAPPPRRMTVDLGEVRVALSMTADGLRVAFQAPPGEAVPAWTADLGSALAARGYDLAGSDAGERGTGRQQSREPQPFDDAVASRSRRREARSAADSDLRL